jgi:hypothetical protein
MTTAVVTKSAPPASGPVEMAAEATKRLETLREQLDQCRIAFQAAADAGDRGAIGKARARWQELRDGVLCEERAILIANVQIAEIAVSEGEGRMREARDVAEEARLAAEQAEAEAKARRTAQVEAGTLPTWQYLQAIASDVYDVDRARQMTAHAAAAARDALLEPTWALERAQAELAAHRRREIDS